MMRKQRPGGTLRRAFALFPVAHGIDRDADPSGERDLRQPDLTADTAGVGGSVAHRLGIVFGDLRGDSASVVASTLVQSTSATSGRSEPSRRTSTTVPSSLRRALVTMSSSLPRVRLARRNDPGRPATQRVHDHEQSPRDPAVEPVTRLAIVPAIVDLDPAIGITKPDEKTALAPTSLALRCVPCEATNIVRRHVSFNGLDWTAPKWVPKPRVRPSSQAAKPLAWRSAARARATRSGRSEACSTSKACGRPSGP